MSGLDVLLLCNVPAGDASAQALAHHVTAFERYSRHRVFRLSSTGALPSRLALDRFDVLVIHHSIWITADSHLAASAVERIGRFGGLKVQFRQDEYFTVDAMTQMMRRLGIDILYTCVPEPEIDRVYPPQALPDVRKIPTLTGFVPEVLLQREVPPIRLRPIDVSYRGRRLPYFLGELGTEKWRIVPQFLDATRHHHLVTDLSCEERDRLYGEAWIRLLASSKCALGVESGASVFDFTGNIHRDVVRYLADHPQAGFEEVRDRIFAEEEGRIRVNQISPRCFEAAALRTAMILFEGEYSGILEPWRHYVPLKKDFSNIEAVVDAIRNPELLQAIAERAYREVAMNPRYSYRNFVAGFDQAVEQEFRARGKAAAPRAYTRSTYRVDLATSPGYAGNVVLRFVLERLFLGARLGRLLQDIWFRIPFQRRERLRPLLKLFGKTDVYMPRSEKP